mmetsp:Transcript_17042/g.48703  ORF Transcript_17042/g.48703 Transcript_17042/m.48703 type:complete len:209 (+) Transcript_17042:696-1322(+)
MPRPRRQHLAACTLRQALGGKRDAGSSEGPAGASWAAVPSVTPAFRGRALKGGLVAPWRPPRNPTVCCRAPWRAVHGPDQGLGHGEAGVPHWQQRAAVRGAVGLAQAVQGVDLVEETVDGLPDLACPLVCLVPQVGHDLRDGDLLLLQLLQALPELPVQRAQRSHAALHLRALGHQGLRDVLGERPQRRLVLLRAPRLRPRDLLAANL